MLRPYQEELKKQVLKAFNKVNRVMLQLPTGGGKTITFVDLASHFVNEGKSVWILVHRKELIEQTTSKLVQYGVRHSVIQADYHYSRFAPCQVVSVQTVVKRLSKVTPPDVIICDEAHHSTASTYRKIYEYYPNAKLLGVTATPVRSNGEGFKDLFDKLICGLSVNDLIKQGYLCKPKIFAKPLTINLNSIKVTAGDFNDADLFVAMNNNETYGDLVASYNQEAKGKKAIVFAVNIEHSKNIVEMYNNAGISAEHLDGNTPKMDRKNILERFKSGKTLVLSNVNIITEGFDVPDCEVVQLVKPTKSLAMYLQMVGRGLRTSPGKDYAIILDHSDSVFYHGFPQQDRKWTLKGKKKVKGQNEYNENVFIRDKESKELYTRKDLPKHITDVELVEINDLTQDEFRAMVMKQLINICIDNGKKRGTAWFTFIKMYKPTIADIETFQILSGHNKGWIWYQKRDFGYL